MPFKQPLGLNPARGTVTLGPMKPALPHRLRFSSLLLFVAGSLVLPDYQSPAQDNVQIPKSRLEELERKEKELERLKGDLNQTKNENQQLKQQKEEAVKTSSIEPLTKPVITHTNQPLATLPQLQPDSVIESMDLAGYYQADATAADVRFRRQKFNVRGEIVGFDKPLLKGNYRVLLKTPDAMTRVVCDFLPPEKANAVFPAEHGAQLVALYGNNRVVIAHLGDMVQVQGECRGISGSEIKIYGRQMIPVP